MHSLRPLAATPLALMLCVACAWSRVEPAAAAPAGTDPWVQGTHVAVRAYSRASDAYAANQLGSVALWVLLIAAALVLLEWLLARRRRGAS